MNFPQNLRYTREHEWILVEGNQALVGITDYAQQELGDIVFVEIETIGQNLKKEEVFGTIEAVKTVSDLFMPVSGKVSELNSAIQDTPELVNQDPYGKGWLIKVEISDVKEIDALMDASQYAAMVNA